MNKTLTSRNNIYDHITGSAVCTWDKSCTPKNFETYCIAKDTIQDTAEALLAHRKKDFVDDVFLRYIEYYGVLQAVYMQQDAIQALYNLFMKPEKLFTVNLIHWEKLRGLRNDTVGHPVVRLKRLNRSMISYDRVDYLWRSHKKKKSLESDSVDLRELLDSYDSEASCVLDCIFQHLEDTCANGH